jgi:glutaredoxin 3
MLQYCTKAKRVLDKYASAGLSYKVIELDAVKNGGAIQSALAEITGQRTVPNVFIGGKSIGGGDETAAADRSGTLSKKLKDAGAISA